MNNIYLDVIEKALSAYTHERIRSYIDEVKRSGLKEHGFPRLGANIGILLAYGRRADLKDIFIEIIDICCEQMPKVKAANDFSVREICCCLMLIEKKGIIDTDLIAKWKGQLASFDPWTRYNEVDDHSGKFICNWAMFAAVSDYMRGIYCGVDTSEFVDWELPSQLANLDENGMYQDAPPIVNPMVYDLVPRFLMAFLLCAGYNGKYAQDMTEALDKSADFTLKMQSVTGEIAFGGRSNQFLNNEAMLIAYCEMEATRFVKKGDIKKAREFKGAAKLATNTLYKYLSLNPISHIKNRYPIESKIGCEPYGYFNKYMITVASNLYPAILFGDDSISPTNSPAEKGGFVICTGEHFHKTFLSAAGYHIEIESNACFNYDANGLGRVHKSGCPSSICLSAPFPINPNYLLEGENPTPMSICCYAVKDGKKLIGAEEYAKHTFVESDSGDANANAVFDVNLSEGIVVTHKYALSAKGVDITFSGYDDIGFMLPVFDYDGQSHTAIKTDKNSVSVEYNNWVCTYRFEGQISSEYTVYYNRNGRYRVYSVATKHLHIDMEEKI